MGATQTRKQAFKLVLRHDAFENARAHIPTDAQLADLLGIDSGQLSRLLANKCRPGNRFIAGVLHAFGIERAGELFDIDWDEDAA